MIGEGNGNPLQYSYLENPMDTGAWQATVHGDKSVGHDLATKQPPLYMIENNKIFHLLLMLFYVLDMRIRTLDIYTPNIQ